MISNCIAIILHYPTCRLTALAGVCAVSCASCQTTISVPESPAPIPLDALWLGQLRCSAACGVAVIRSGFAEHEMSSVCSLGFPGKPSSCREGLGTVHAAHHAHRAS